MAPQDTSWLKDMLLPQLYRLEGKIDGVQKGLHDLHNEVRQAQSTADAAIRGQQAAAAAQKSDRQAHDRLCADFQDLETRVDAARSEETRHAAEAQIRDEKLQKQVDAHAKEAEPLLRMGPTAIDHISEWVDEDTARKIWLRTVRTWTGVITAVATTIAFLYAGWHWLKNHT